MNQEFKISSASVASPRKGTDATDSPQVVFLFPAEGFQRVDMARPLYDTEPVFRAAVDACATFLQPLLKHDLRSTLFPADDERDHAERDIQRPLFTQPCVFTISYAFACFWISRGVTPSLLIGHGIGEYVAAVIARSFTLENALTLLACRARLMQGLPAGGMLAIHAGADHLALPDGIDLAAIDASDRCTVSGSRESIHAYQKLLESRNTSCHVVRSSHAFHSAAMDPIIPTFTGDAAMIPCAPPCIPWISTCTGSYLDEEMLADPAYWARQLRQPVDFHGALTTAFAKTNQVVLEVGPGRLLASLAMRHPDRGTAAVLSSQADGNHDLADARATLDQLRHAGLMIAPEGTAPERPLSQQANPHTALVGPPLLEQDCHVDFTQVESALESHPTVSQAIVTLCDGNLVAYLRFTATVSSIESTTSASVEAMAKRILNYGPRRIFEIGCGTGQLLARLAPAAECYWASDPSPTTIKELGVNHPLPQVRLTHRRSDDFNGLPDGDFDTVIIHSVARSFPDATTLSRVLEGAGNLLAPGGRIFLADMVGNALLPVRHTAALAPCVPEGTTAGQLRESVSTRVSRETRLAVDPAWFDHLILRITELGPVEILLHRGTADAVETSYHYDVVLHKQTTLRLQPLPPATPWSNLNLEQLEALLHEQPEDLHLTGIPNALLVADIAFHRLLAAGPADRPLPVTSHCRANAATAEDLFQLAAQAGFTAHVRWQGDGTSGLLEAAFIRDQPGALPAWPRAAAPLPPSSLVNKPHPRVIPSAPDLHAHLVTRLPHSMIPSSFVVVENFPFTPEGLVDRDALPPPYPTARSASTPCVPAANDRESQLLEIWKQVLGREDIGTSDDILDIGGDSILIFQIAIRSSRAGLPITAEQILHLRTVSAVVADFHNRAR